MSTKKIWIIFFGYYSTPWGVPKWRKNLKFHVFTIFWQFLAILVNLNMKNQPKPRFLLKYGLKHKKKLWPPQGVTPLIITPGGQTPNFRQKKSQNSRILTFRTFQRCKISKMSHLTWSVILFLQNKWQNRGA